MNPANLTLGDATRRQWDVIIVGSGMAGATLGHALAVAGRQVLFCEKGKALLPPTAGLRGNFAESFFTHPAVPDRRHRDTLAQAGRYTERLTDLSGPRARHGIPFIGCGTGGSSALYGAAMERFFPADFTPRQHHPDAGESTLPAQWPISYEEMLPYYERAERLYRVRGGADPCRPDMQTGHLRAPPPLCAPSQALRGAFAAQGLHPYRLPQACEFVPGCRGCQGFLCPGNCKNDSVRMCLAPALADHGARLLEECDVLRLEADAGRVTGVVCSRRGQQATLRGTLVILAAGALETPRILLNSATPDWPDGLANASGLVGRNLMRHYVDMYALLPGVRDAHPGNLKELAFNDFYLADGHKFGTVQSFGALPAPAIVAEEMQQDLSDSPRRWLVPFFRLGKPLLHRVLGRMLARRILYASIMEDLPYRDNRVTVAAAANPVSGSRLSIHYRIRSSEQARIQSFRQHLRTAFGPNRPLLIKQAENNARIAHACGTCRFGTDPRTSVLNATNRAHALDNLYVVDASFFPSSGGTNPALTLAANALRVADHILGATTHRQSAATQPRRGDDKYNRTDIPDL